MTLLQCNTSTDHNCNHNEDAGVICVNTTPLPCTNGDVYLTGGLTGSEGTVQFCYNNEFGTVCDDLWDGNDASVVCKMLGYSSGTAVSFAHFGVGSGDIVLDNVQCTGEELTLLDCPAITDHNCNHIEDAGVICEIPMNCTTSGSVFLTGGTSESEGTVQLCYNNEWGTVCDIGWSDNDADVVCQQLGYLRGIAVGSAYFGFGSGDIVYDDVQCTGSEMTLLECPASTDNNCFHNEDAGVVCANTTLACTTNGIVYLTGGSTGSEGTVQLCYNNEWGTVCDNLWDDVDAAVVCRQLGYFNGTAVGAAYFGFGSGEIVFNDVQCSGSETSLLHCSATTTDHNCNHLKAAGVICVNATTPCINGDVYLAGESGSEGTVQLCYNNEWGTVCDNGWTGKDADVVCRQLGYLRGTAVSLSYFGVGTGDIVLDNVQCTGEEQTLLQCTTSTDHNCNHIEDAGVICVNTTSMSCTNGSVYLTGGSSESEGTVQLCYNNEFGTVCDDLWDDNDAAVVCQQLGYPDGSARKLAYFGIGSGEIVLDNVQCNGSEMTLLQCDATTDHDCYHYEDAGVTCYETAVSNSTSGFVPSTVYPSTTFETASRNEVLSSSATMVSTPLIISSSQDLASTNIYVSPVTSVIPTPTGSASSQDVIRMESTVTPVSVPPTSSEGSLLSTTSTQDLTGTESSTVFYGASPTSINVPTPTSSVVSIASSQEDTGAESTVISVGVPPTRTEQISSSQILTGTESTVTYATTHTSVISAPTSSASSQEVIGTESTVTSVSISPTSSEGLSIPTATPQDVTGTQFSVGVRPTSSEGLSIPTATSQDVTGTQSSVGVAPTSSEGLSIPTSQDVTGTQSFVGFPPTSSEGLSIPTATSRDVTGIQSSVVVPPTSSEGLTATSQDVTGTQSSMGVQPTSSEGLSILTAISQDATGTQSSVGVRSTSSEGLSIPSQDFTGTQSSMGVQPTSSEGLSIPTATSQDATGTQSSVGVRSTSSEGLSIPTATSQDVTGTQSSMGVPPTSSEGLPIPTSQDFTGTQSSMGVPPTSSEGLSIPTATSRDVTGTQSSVDISISSSEGLVTSSQGVSSTQQPSSSMAPSRMPTITVMPTPGMYSCDEQNGGCEHYCNNMDGSVTCTCRSGYTLAEDQLSCNDVDECRVNNGDCGQVCNNTEGSYECTCLRGYEISSDKKTCIDINECDVDNGGCNHICFNQDGGHRCDCENRFQLDEDRFTCIYPFKVFFNRVENCYDWISSDLESKIRDMRSEIARGVESLCRCGFTGDFITYSQLTCPTQRQSTKAVGEAVVYAAALINIDQLEEDVIGHLEQWVASGDTVSVNGTALSVDPSCDTELNPSTDQLQCTNDVATTSTPSLSTEPPSDSSDSVVLLLIIISSVLGSLLLVAAAAVIIVVVYLRRKYRKYEFATAGSGSFSNTVMISNNAADDKIALEKEMETIFSN